jgi:hypothetical protein
MLDTEGDREYIAFDVFSIDIARFVVIRDTDKH